MNTCMFMGNALCSWGFESRSHLLWDEIWENSEPGGGVEMAV